MKTVQLIADIYTNGYKNIGNLVLRHYLKVFAWFSFILFAVVLYAFVYRVATGFAFD